MIHVRPLEPAEASWARALLEAEGWGVPEEEWRLCHAPEGAGCFVAECDGTPAGLVTSQAHGPSLGWIGALVVDPGHRRHAVGSRLLGHAVESLRAGGSRAIGVDAPEEAVAFLAAAGFQHAGEIGCYQATGLYTTDPSRFIAPIAEEDLDALVGFDAAHFGERRHALLFRHVAAAPQLCYLFRTAEGPPEGYILARPAGAGFCVGPWVATEAAIADELLKVVLGALDTEQVCVCVPEGNEDALAFMLQYQFDMHGSLVRMFLGDPPAQAHQAIFATSGRFCP